MGINTEESTEMNRKARFLLRKIMYLSSNLLPEVPQVASLVNVATDFDHSFHNHVQFVDSTTNENIKRSRATKIIKELSEISLKNPLEIHRDNELFHNSLSMCQLNNMMQNQSVAG